MKLSDIGNAALVGFACGFGWHLYVFQPTEIEVAARPTIEQATIALRGYLGSKDTRIAVEKIGECMPTPIGFGLSTVPGPMCMTSSVMVAGEPPTSAVIGFYLNDERWVMQYLRFAACYDSQPER